MTASEIAAIAARLEATGLTFARGELDRSGNRTALVPVPWESALVRILGMTGWRIADRGRGESVVIPLRRS